MMSLEVQSPESLSEKIQRKEKISALFEEQKNKLLQYLQDPQTLEKTKDLIQSLTPEEKKIDKKAMKVLQQAIRAVKTVDFVIKKIPKKTTTGGQYL